MYYVDREKITQLLQFIEGRLQLVNQTESFNNELDSLALERITHTLIEAILDVGNAMIDGFIMRDPGSYEDIVDILLDEKVVDEQLAGVLIQLIGYRKPLVQQFATEDVDGLEAFLKGHYQLLMDFPQVITTYLTNELGPVSAFKN